MAFSWNLMVISLSYNHCLLQKLVIHNARKKTKHISSFSCLNFWSHFQFTFYKIRKIPTLDSLSSPLQKSFIFMFPITFHECWHVDDLFSVSLPFHRECFYVTGTCISDLHLVIFLVFQISSILSSFWIQRSKVFIIYKNEVLKRVFLKEMSSWWSDFLLANSYDLELGPFTSKRRLETPSFMSRGLS